MPQPENTALFEAQRPRLLRLAYRMLGSVAEAEDVVQDAWLRWSEASDIESPPAWLTRVVTRLCLDRMKSARARRETYFGTWLPEPLLEPEAIADDVTLTLMLALERLSPLERAAFLLHDVFEVSLGDVAATLGRDAAAVRQLAVRARRHVQESKSRYMVEDAEAERIAQAFFAATRDGDTAALQAMLAEDVVIHADGGGRVLAFRNPIRGIARVLRLYASLFRKFGDAATLLRTQRIDGLPGFVSLDRGDVLQTTALAIEDGCITAIYIVRNPDKLGHVIQALPVN
ncbi:sigma-70 family RNA polymerase sigma factor [Sphingosinicella xenopeptidilytica]|uniref:Sigma-70 family RNA polymerase sigma factor n=1 Tax=Sphingosinicella xenopeptidilytica TaxID=364098 RepID=A0ABW3C8F5_SPHXN